MKAEYVCTVCPIGCVIIYEDGEISGNSCVRGYNYVMNEIVAPKRVISSTVKLTGSIHRRLPVKLDKAIPKEFLIAAVAQLNTVEVAVPVKVGEIIIENVLDTGANFVAARTII